MNENENLSKLCKKILAITTEIGKVAKDGNNTHSNYHYITYEQMNLKMRELLPKYNLAIIPEITEVRETQYQAKNNTGVRSLVKATFQIVDCDTGFSITKIWNGGDQDVGGKSLSQATTECHKRFLLKLFNVSSKGDVDPDSRTESMPNQPQPANNQPQNSGTISEKQAGRLKAIIGKSAYKMDYVEGWLNVIHGTTIENMQWKLYDEICKTVESGTIPEPE